MLNLAVADELLLCTLPFLCVSSYTSDWMFGEHVCRITNLFRESNKYTGILTLVALSVDRCLASYHNTAAVRRVPVGISVCVCIWLVSLLVSLPYATNAMVKTSTAGRRGCGLQQQTVPLDRAWTYLQLILGLAVPLVVITGANAILLYRLRRRCNRHHASTTGRSGSTGSQGGGRQRLTPAFGPMAMARLVIVVVGVFVGCQLPYHVVEMMSLKIHERKQEDGTMPSPNYTTVFIYANTAAQILVYVSSCCNPIIYGIFNHNYRT